jgi:hypothetical protein
MLGIWCADSHLESCAVQWTVVCDRQKHVGIGPSCSAENVMMSIG